MKKYILLVFALCVTSLTFAQEENKVKFEEKGDLIEATYYHDNGVIAQKGTFKDNRLHGVWTSFNIEGKKLTTGTYDQGKKIGKWFFWEGDSLKEVDYTNNVIANVVVWGNANSLAVRDK